MGVLKTPKNLAQPKKRGKIKATPFLDAFEVSGSGSEVRISVKILVLKLSNLMTLIVRNCIPEEIQLKSAMQPMIPEPPVKKGPWYLALCQCTKYAVMSIHTVAKKHYFKAYV